jgi:hypothetical protein
MEKLSKKIVSVYRMQSKDAGLPVRYLHHNLLNVINRL